MTRVNQWARVQLLVIDMLNRLLQWYRNKKGQVSIWTCWIFLIIFMIGMITFEFLRISAVCNALERHVQQSILAVVTENYQEIYSGVKKGTAASYSFDETSADFSYLTDEGDVMRFLANDMHLSSCGTGCYVSQGNDYTIKNLRLSINSDSKVVQGSGVFKIDADFDVTIPFKSVLSSLPEMDKQLHLTARWMKID